MHLRRLLSVASSLVWIGIGAMPAKADVLYTFTGLGTTATFSLPNNPTPSLVGSDFFQINNLVVTVAGLGTFTGNVDFFDTAAGGGAGSGVDVLHGPQLFSGTLTDPVMLTGMFPLSGTVTPDSDGDINVTGTLVATPAASAVPEPSSAFLFFTGIGTVAGALELRRRAFMH
jgi:hypothetical protein